MSSCRCVVLLSCGAALVASACSAGPARRPVGAVVTDSAGVTIVTSPAAMQAFEHWTLAPDPEVRIGSAGGEAPYQLYQVTGAVRLSTGDVVVANRGTNELRWYDSEGTYRFTRGGTGGGPGQYRGLRTLLVLGGDSVLAGDLLLNSVHLYSPTGGLVRSWRIGELGRLVAPAPFARLADGTFVAMTEHELSQPPGYVRSEIVVVRYRDGQVLDTVAVAPGGESYQSSCGPNNQAICNWGVPFGLRAHAIAQGTRILVGNGDGYVIRVFDPSGRLTAIYRRDVPREAVTSAHVGRWVDSVLAATAVFREPHDGRRRRHLGGTSRHRGRRRRTLGRARARRRLSDHGGGSARPEAHADRGRLPGGNRPRRERRGERRGVPHREGCLRRSPRTSGRASP